MEDDKIKHKYKTKRQNIVLLWHDCHSHAHEMRENLIK